LKHGSLTIIQGMLFGEEEWGMTWLELDGNQSVSYTIVEIKARKTG